MCRVMVYAGEESDMTHHDHGHAHDWAFEGPEEVERVTRDGEVALPFVGLVLDQLGTRDVRRVLDVGPGPGVGTCELARLLPDATVIALEPSASMADAIVARAASEGVGERVQVRQGGLPEGLADLADIDLVWASMSLHHVADEVGALRALAGVMNPGGVIALVERGAPNRVLPDLGDPGLAERLDAAYGEYFSHMRHTLPGEIESGDLAAMVEQAGLRVSSDAEEVVTHAPPLTADQRAFVAAWTGRTLHQLEDSLTASDLDLLRGFVADPRRPDAPITIARRVLIASR